jgi:outer membrane protein OmpA-like peptidoglycan-associated protein
MEGATMPNNLLDAFQSLLTPDMVGRMASATGESNIAVSKAASAAGPLILAGLVQQAGDSGMMTRIMSLLNSPTVGGNPLGNLGNLFGITRSPLLEQGGKFLAAIFGNRQDAIRTALGQHAGIRPGSAARILGFAAPILMALMGDRVRSENMSVGGLSRWVLSQKEELRGIPSSLLNDAGLGELGEAGVTAGRAVIEEAPPVRRWVMPVGIGLLILLGFWTVLARRPAEPAPVAEGLLDTSPATPRAIPATTPTATPDLGEFVSRPLPNGVTLRVPSRGVEVRIIQFIDNPALPVEPPHWYNFDRVLFETNSATLQPSSREQLRNVADILRAYPTVHLKIGGYTDSTGDAAANLKLSQDRASNVLNELVGLGVSKDRLEAEGYGQQHPVGDNTTEAGRAQNRRIALRVTKR